MFWYRRAMPLRKRGATSVVATAEVDQVLDLAAALSVQSLDLRAEYEAKLRILTAIQRDLESLRSSTAIATRQRQTLERLERGFAELTRANRDASDTLMLIREEFERMHRRTRPLRRATIR
jgi:hypothetical protein